MRNWEHKTATSRSERFLTFCVYEHILEHMVIGGTEIAY